MTYRAGGVENLLYPACFFMKKRKPSKMRSCLGYLFAALFSLYPLLGAETAVDGSKGISRAFQKAQTSGENVVSITGKESSGKGKKKEKSTEQMLKDLKDDEILVEIDGRDALKWGLLRRHVDALCAGIERSEMQMEGNAALRSIMFQSRVRKLLKEYIEYTLVAAEARREGVTVAPEKFAEYRARARAEWGKRGELGKVMLNLINSGESFYEHNLTNALYSQAYQKQVLLPMTETNEAEIRQMMGIVHSNNTAVVETNLYKRALAADILGKLRGGMDFGDAAEQWSDGESSATRGVMMDGTDEHPARFAEGELPKAVEDALANLKEGEMSGIVETPDAWRIVQLLKRNGSAEQDGEVSVEIAEILLEKDMLQPELSPEQARERIKEIKMKAVTKMKFHELLAKAKVECKIPLWEPSDPSKKRMRIKRVK